MEPDVDNDGDGLESLPLKLGDVNLTQSSSLNISGGTTAKLGSRVVEGIMSKDVVPVTPESPYTLRWSPRLCGFVSLFLIWDKAGTKERSKHVVNYSMVRRISSAIGYIDL